MGIAQRIHDTIETWQAEWKGRLSGWMVSWLGSGLETFTSQLEPGLLDMASDTVSRMLADPNIPQEMKDALRKATERGNILETIYLEIIMILQSAGLVIQGSVPISNELRYAQDYLKRSSRLDPLSVIAAWRRDPVAYEKYLDDLREQGWSDERIEAIKFITQAMPTPRDIVGFLAHEVFEPDMVSKYGLLSEWGVIDKEFAKKIGMMEDTLQLYWMDHWEHPEWTTIQELRHRGKINDQDVKDWFRLVEIPEYWRDPMLEVLWALPNRIEIRMMARYLDLSKQEVMDLLEKAGLHADYRSDAADFMIIMGLTGYWADMLSNGWMTPEQLQADIAARGLKPVTAERIYRSLVKANIQKVTEVEKTLTKTEIYKGVREGVITYEDGVELIMDLNYTRPQAEYLLTINVEALAGSPKDMAEFKDITQKWRKAAGMDGETMPEEIKEAADKLVKARLEVEALERAVKEEKALLGGEEAAPEDVSKKLKQLQVALNRARAELQRIQLDYNSKVAAWRHGQG